jgi:tetratricopeptide (TPR) repeat protein
MKEKNLKLTYLLGLFLIIFVGVLNHSLNKPKITVSRSEEAVNFSPIFLKLISFGNQRFFSSILWTHTLLSSDLKYYKENDLSSWMYLRFHTITELDPLFYEAYFYGGQYLSVIKDDVFGAEAIYNKGLKKYPNAYWLIYHTAFNYYFEIGDHDKGIEYFTRLNDHPDRQKNTPQLSTLLATLIGRSGDLEAANELVIHTYNTTRDPVLKKRLLYLIHSIKVNKDLKCLNERLGDCNTRDPKNDLYILNNSQYKSINTWKDFSKKAKKRVRK